MSILMAHGYGAIAQAKRCAWLAPTLLSIVHRHARSRSLYAYTAGVPFRTVATNLDDLTPDCYVSYYTPGSHATFRESREQGVR